MSQPATHQEILDYFTQVRNEVNELLIGHRDHSLQNLRIDMNRRFETWMKLPPDEALRYIGNPTLDAIKQLYEPNVKIIRECVAALSPKLIMNS